MGRVRAAVQNPEIRKDPSQVLYCISDSGVAELSQAYLNQLVMSSLKGNTPLKEYQSKLLQEGV